MVSIEHLCFRHLTVEFCKYLECTVKFSMLQSYMKVRIRYHLLHQGNWTLKDKDP